ncbi:MAG: hypothetical protein IMY72_03440 [Bacteroidetes bacterium]|nr:hypothetical protein [Bacteroidota bacterium]
MTIKERIKKSITLAIIIFSIVSFLAGIVTYKGILAISQLKMKDNKQNSIKNEINNTDNSVVVGKDKDGRMYCIATGRSIIRGSQMIAFQKAKMNAKVKLTEKIHGIQITHEDGLESRKTSTVSEGTITGVQEIERNIINDSIAEIKLQLFFDEQN